VTVDLDSLLGHPGAVGGELGGAGPLDPAACRRLACDAAVTRVLVTRHPTKSTSPSDPTDPTDNQRSASSTHSMDQDLTARLQAAMALLPPVLGGAPSQPLDVGRASRVVQPAQRSALAVRDGGCGFPGCDRPLAWCEAHHLVHWLHGGPTDLANLALLCRAHHRAVHEGGWRLTRQPDGQLTATPPHRPRPPHRRHRPAA
jgi:HNH endonuclease